MEIHWIPFQSVPQLASSDVAYATANPALRPFYKYPVSIDVFGEVIRDKKRDAIDRELLVSVLKTQYGGLATPPAVLKHIEELGRENTFTVATAHQPALFMGPLYYVYKIFSTLNLAGQLQTAYPAYNFVPVFINGAEDHDFEEINHTYIFGNKLEWKTSAGGPTGMLSTRDLNIPLDALKDLLADNPMAESLLKDMFAAFTTHERYGEAVIDLLNRVFGKYGLVVLDMQHSALKRRFIPLMREELFNQSSQPLVEATQKALLEHGFPGQAYAREINLFYLQPGLRARIISEDGHFKVLGTELAFTKEEMDAELQAFPERFSPNVILRPLYQESILPNLAYIGGGGEIAYWLERKSQFEHFGVNFPMLVRRNSVLWIDRATRQKMERFGIGFQQLFQETDLLVRQFVAAQSTAPLDLNNEIKALSDIFERVRTKAVQVDPTLEKAVLAEAVKQAKVLEQLENRIVRAEKHKHETTVNQLRTLREKLFPNNGLQERHYNFMIFYLLYGEDFFQMLKRHLHPLENGFLIIEDV